MKILAQKCHLGINSENQGRRFESHAAEVVASFSLLNDLDSIMSGFK